MTEETTQARPATQLPKPTGVEALVRSPRNRR
jgi:hypothetical protein